MKQALFLLCITVTSQTFAQAGSEIFLFDLRTVYDKVYISNGGNITNHKGYDNQPFFHPAFPIIYYSSFDEKGRSDLKYYNYTLRQTTNLTLTPEREYSPTVTPDRNYISCIIQRDNGAQDLGKIPIRGGVPEVLIDNLTVGYHAWADANHLLLFVLDDSTHFSLRYYDLAKKTDTVIAQNIGRSLHKIPGQNAMSFTQKIADNEFVIKKFDLDTRTVSTITAALPGQDQLCWLQYGIILMSDGKQLFSYPTRSSDPKANWQPVTVEGDASMLKGVTRVATNFANTKLAIVVSE
jgi:hypothetical protein